MQRRLAGYARAKIYLAQDFLATFAREDDRGYITEEAKRWVVRMNDLMIPWVYVLARTTDDRKLKRVLEMTQDEGAEPRKGAAITKNGPGAQDACKEGT